VSQGRLDHLDDGELLPEMLVRIAEIEHQLGGAIRNKTLLVPEGRPVGQRRPITDHLIECLCEKYELCKVLFAHLIEPSRASRSGSLSIFV